MAAKPLRGRAAAMAAAAAKATNRFTAVAGIAEGRLGLVPQAMPPQRVIMKAVDEGGWAERSGVCVGDELVAVESQEITEMTSEELKAVLKGVRPVELTFTRVGSLLSPSTITLVAGEEETRLGLAPSARPPHRVFVSRVDAGGWGDRSGVLLGDELINMAGRDVSSMSADDFAATLANVRPLQLTLVRGSAPAADATPSAPPTVLPQPEFTRPLQLTLARGSAPAADATPPAPPTALPQPELTRPLRPLQGAFSCVAGPADTWLGLKTSGLPPDRVTVTGVHAGSWAEQAGVLAGHEVLAINGRTMAEMAGDEFLDLTTVIRPVELTFRGDRGPGRGSLPMAASADYERGAMATLAFPRSDGSRGPVLESGRGRGVDHPSMVPDPLCQDVGALGRRFGELEAAWSRHHTEFAQARLFNVDLDPGGNARVAASKGVAASRMPRVALAHTAETQDTMALLQDLLQRLDTLEGRVASKAKEGGQDAHAQKVDRFEDYYAALAGAARVPSEGTTGGTPLTTLEMPANPFESEMRRLYAEVEALRSEARSTAGASAGGAAVRRGEERQRQHGGCRRRQDAWGRESGSSRARESLEQEDQDDEWTDEEEDEESADDQCEWSESEDASPERSGQTDAEALTEEEEAPQQRVRRGPQQPAKAPPGDAPQTREAGLWLI